MSGKEGNVVVIVHVNKEYEDVANVFTYLFKLNWPDCPYKVIYSYTPTLFGNYGFEKYESKDGILGNNVYQIMTKYNADYAISLLGDAFITHKVDTRIIKDRISQLKEQHFDYCRLYHSGNKTKKLEHIRKSELYGISFIAFICSYKFAELELQGQSDLTFEKKYLEITRSCNNKNNVYRSFGALPNKIFGIRHGIVKGKWIRKTYNNINKQINIKEIAGNRECMSIVEDMIFNTKLFIRNNLISCSMQKKFSNF